MSIQAGINRALSVAGFFASQSPALQAKAKERAEIGAINVKQKKINKQVNTVADEGLRALDEALAKEESGEAVTPEEFGEAERNVSDLVDVQRHSVELAKRKFELKPTVENYREIGLKEDMANALEETLVTAREKLFTKQEEKRASRRSFIDYMKDEPTSFGKTVGELDPKIQKSILKDYSKAERKKIMDERDKLNEQ